MGREGFFFSFLFKRIHYVVPHGVPASSNGDQWSKKLYDERIQNTKFRVVPSVLHLWQYFQEDQ